MHAVHVHKKSSATTGALLPCLAHAGAACQAFLADGQANRRLVAVLYWLLRHVASMLFLGTRESLAAAAAASSEVDRCVAVVWALEVGGVPDRVLGLWA